MFLCDSCQILVLVMIPGICLLSWFFPIIREYHIESSWTQYSFRHKRARVRETLWQTYLWHAGFWIVSSSELHAPSSCLVPPHPSCNVMSSTLDDRSASLSLLLSYDKERATVLVCCRSRCRPSYFDANVVFVYIFASPMRPTQSFPL